MSELVVCNGKQYEIGKFYQAAGSIVQLADVKGDRDAFPFLCRGDNGSRWYLGLSEVDESVLGKVTIPVRVLDIGKLYEFSDDEDFDGSTFGILNRIDHADVMPYLCADIGSYKYCRVIQMEVGK